MFKEFALVDLKVNAIEKTIKLFFTNNVDASTVSADTIALVHAETQKIHRLQFKTSKKCIIISVLDEINPNEEYRIDINKTIKDIVGTPLQSSLIRHINFETNIASNVKVIAPANHELIDGNFIVEWQEILRDRRRKPTLEYRLQISSDVAFNVIKLDTVVYKKQQLTLPALTEGGQYFLRIRVEKDGEYGSWSPTTTFSYVGPERIIDRQEIADNNPHKISPVSIFAPYNYKTDMHNNKRNMDTNPSDGSPAMSAGEIANATNESLPTDTEGTTSAATSLTNDQINKILDTGDSTHSAVTIKLADGTIINKATASGQAGVVVDESPATIDDIKPVVIQELKVIKRPQQGTSDVFVFEFDAEIKDLDILNSIEIIRKDF